MSRPDSERFERLTEYVEGYRPGAVRYDMGQNSNFISIPMLNESLNQVLKWGIQEIQDYCRSLADPILQFFQEKEIPVEEDAYRASHLMGLQLPKEVDSSTLMRKLQEKKIFVSLRGSNIRISINVFNTEEDIDQLIAALDL
jgi:selenocysteine lyase/cysteine desulfurase